MMDRDRKKTQAEALAKLAQQVAETHQIEEVALGDLDLTVFVALIKKKEGGVVLTDMDNAFMAAYTEANQEPASSNYGFEEDNSPDYMPSSSYGSGSRW